MAEVPDAKMQKADVNYKMHEKCLQCNYFYNPNSCSKVDGNVSQEAWCKLWELQSKKEPMDGAGYMAEYDKLKAK